MTKIMKNKNLYQLLKTDTPLLKETCFLIEQNYINKENFPYLLKINEFSVNTKKGNMKKENELYVYSDNDIHIYKTYFENYVLYRITIGKVFNLNVKSITFKIENTNFNTMGYKRNTSIFNQYILDVAKQYLY